MIREALEYLITPCPQPYRRLGYLRELIATEARYRRCRDSWQSHLANCQQTINAAAAQASGRELAIVLGGGMLHDIPLDDLAAIFNRIVLVDVCFARTTLKTVNRLPNVETRFLDLTGLTDAIANWSGRPIDDAKVLERNQADMSFVHDADLVISANVLPQLPLIPIARLHERSAFANDTVAGGLGQAIVRDHLDMLDACRGTVCLISETARMTTNRDTVLERDDALFGVTLPQAQRTWDWAIAPRPERYPDRDVVFAVASNTVNQARP